MRILLVRHGQSEWNASRRLQGQADIELSDQGRAQADALRNVIEQIGPCRAVSSDLGRVQETVRRLGVADAQPDKGLREIDVGEWTGRRIPDLIAENEDQYLAWRAGTNTPPGGELWEDFADRVTSVINREAKSPCQNLLVACHGGVVRAILQRFLNLQPANIIPVAPASLTALRLANGSGKPVRLELFNYLPDQLEFEAPD